MKRQRHGEEQIIAVLQEAQAGATIEELCRRHGISQGTYYKWKQSLPIYIPHRWSIAHLYQDFEQGTSWQGYQLSDHVGGLCALEPDGAKVFGVGYASGMFPIDSKTNDYDASKIELINKRLVTENIGWKLQEFCPKSLPQGTAGSANSIMERVTQLKSGTPLANPIQKEATIRFDVPLRQFFR